MRARPHSLLVSLALGLSLFMLGGCQTACKMASPAKGWLPRVPSRESAMPGAEKTVRSRGLALTLHLEPVPAILSETRRIEATLRLANVSSRFIHLEFATSQRFDLLVRDAAGRVLVQWSEDRALEAVPGYVGINPGEHLEYHAAFSTRDLQPGKRYTVTALVTGRDELKAELPLAPEP